MPFEHVLQASRFELKYVIDEQRAHGVRDFVKNFLEPDEHADPSAPRRGLSGAQPLLRLAGLDYCINRRSRV